MNRTRPSLLWLVALGLLLILAPLFFLWWYRGAGWTASRPIGLFMPERASAALCLRQPLDAWNRHWRTRTGPAPEDALKAILEATGTWDRWVKKHGEIQSQMRVKLFQEVFFRTIGDEAWLVFGEWGGARPGEGQAGLVAFIRGNTPVLPRIGPLLELLLDDYTLQSSACEGETVYQYQDARLGRCLTLCQVGGWLCVSMRRRDAGPLPAIIRRVKAADAGTTHALATNPVVAVTSATQSLACAWQPAVFWKQLDAFNKQRGRKTSKKTREGITAWQAQLSGIDMVAARQEGDSLLGLRLDARGPRLTALNRKELDSERLEIAHQVNHSPEVPPLRGEAGEVELARLELSVPAAATILPHDLMAGLKNAAWFDLFMPGVRGHMEAALAGGEGSAAGGRFGLAAYASPTQLLPRVVFWDNHVSSGSGHAGRTATNKTVAPPRAAGSQVASDSPDASALNGEWPKFVANARERGGPAPQAFASLNFHELGSGLEKVPTLFMKKKEQKKLKTWKSTVRALALAVGGAAARIDGAGDHWVMTLDTP